MRDWQDIDSNLRRVAKARAVLDVDEARWLRAAEAAEVHLYVGCSSLVEYLEAVLGYSPKVAVERLRVANALGELPVTEAALEDGQLTFSAVRELTRVAIPETERVWVAASVGKRVHQVERMVSGRQRGDLPTDPRTPDLETQMLRYEVATQTAALERQVRRLLEDEVGAGMNDDAFMAAVFRTALAARQECEPPGRSPNMVVTMVCEKCEAGQQLAGGKVFDVHPKAVERVLCDAQHVGHVDGDAPERAAQEPSPAVRRMVLLRDHQRCRVPWCRAARNLDVHHREGRHGVDCHAPDKLVTLCSFHHVELHDGVLTIRAEDDELVFTHSNPRVGAQFRPHTGARAEVASMH